MTIHNLNDHLSWLLTSRTSIPTSGPQALATETSLSSAGTAPVQNPQKRLPEGELDAFTCNLNRLCPGDGEIQPSHQSPSAPKISVNTRNSESMARLQSGPASTKKPKLISQSALDSRHTPNTHQDHDYGISLRDRYCPPYGAKASDAPVHGETGKQNRSQRQGQASVSKARVANSIPFSIDLSGDSDLRSSSSSTDEVFGESRQLWREDSATRKEPIFKRGRKRKSEEFELESKLSQSSFTAVENYPDEILPTQRQNKSSQHTSHNSQKEHSSQRLPDIKPIAQEGLKSKLDAPNKKPRNSKSHEQFSLTKTVPTPDPRLKKQEYKDEEQCPTNIKSLSGSRRGNTIADSEDEDEELESQAFYRGSTADARVIGKLENVNAAYPTIPAGIERSTQKRSPAKVKNNPGVPMSSIKVDDNREKSYSTKTSNDASPFQRDSPTKLPSAHLEHVGTINSSTDGAKITLAETERASLEKFVGLQLDDLQEYRKQLHHGLRSAAKEICQCIEAGGGGTPEMHQRSTSFSLKINAVDTLLELKGNYNQIRMQNQLLKERVYSILIEKQNISQDDIQNINSVANRLLQTELRILKLLIQAAIPFDDLVSCHRSKTVDPKDDSGGQSTLQVRSTQLPSDYSNTRIDASTVLDSTSSIGQAMHQAHAPDLNPRSPKKLPAMSYSHLQRSPLHTYTSSPRSKDVSAYISPSKRKPRQENCFPSINSRSDRNVGTGKSFADAQSSRSKMPIPNYDDDDDEEEEEYTLNMGSPLRMMSREDDYGHEDDDEMLEAAEEFESRGIKSRSTFETTERLIFAETSPNIVRPEPKKPRSALINPSTQASHMQHVWSRDLKAAMKERFHLRGFRPNQLEAINATLSGKDTFVLMPTGGGKSLCYQLPAIIRSGKTRGVTVVISPLLSLMQDQVDHLQNLKIQAFLTNGEVSAEHRRFIIDSLRDPSVEKYIQLLYITPEMISKNQVMVGILRDLYKKKKLARIVIDEAHCVSQWGHDFRPDYKLLGDVREQFQGVPVMALTATATENVKVDVIHNLRIQNCEVLTQSFNRPNLTYDVRSKGKGVEVQENIATTIKTQYKDQSGIIYCLSRQSCEKLAKTLREVYNIKAQHYHAGMDPAAKSQVQKGWQAGEHNVIVATIAFGMGIDKPDVRFVIHHTIPKSLEGYYQETGRAGRDGKRSGCYLYYGYQDTAALKRMIDAGEGSWEQKERQRQMLRNVIGFCENRSDCRRVQVLNYFNESFKREDCEGGCDNCNEKCTFESRDFTEFAAAAIALVRRVEHQQVTLLHCVDVFRGVKGKKITQLGHCDLDQYGTGSNLERGDIERLFYRLLSEDALSEESIVNKAGFPSKYLHLGPNHNDFTRGVRKLKIQIRVSPNSKIPKIKKPIKNKGTGVAASRHEYPLSTNVSSPIQAASRRRIAQYKSDMNPHSNGYSRDDFVVSDDEINASDRSDEESDGFEPVRKAGKPRITRKRQLGPPITTDQKLEKLNSIHRLVVDDFVGQAKEESARILVDKNLLHHPFTDTVLREMAINFPKDERELLEIPGIDPDKVERYGKRFLRLVQNAHRGYESMIAHQEDRPQDPNHETVVVIISDDEFGDDGNFDDFVTEDDHQEERSSYFQAPPEVNAFNARFSNTQATAAAQPRAQSQSQDSKRYNPYQRGRGGSRGASRGSFGKKRRKASNGEGRSKATGKARSSGKTFDGGKPQSGGIGMMPI